MNPVLYNGWWTSTDTRLGPYTIAPSQPVTEKQLYNAYKLKRFFESWPEGWTLSAICGVIGNFMHESTLSPARVQATHVGTDWPYPIATLEDVPNSRMIDFYNTQTMNYALGLASWDGPNQVGTVPYGQKLVSYAIRQNMNWYDGELQCKRLRAEYDNDLQFNHREVFGTVWTWQLYIVNTRTPEVSADIWRHCYERPTGGFPESEQNARWWFDYFTEHPTPPFNKQWMFAIISKRKKVAKSVKRFY